MNEHIMGEKSALSFQDIKKYSTHDLRALPFSASVDNYQSRMKMFLGGVSAVFSMLHVKSPVSLQHDVSQRPQA